MDDGLIAGHRYNATLFVECMAASVNNYIQDPFANGCNMKMTQLDRTQPEEFSQIKSMTTLPKFNNVMAF